MKCKPYSEITVEIGTQLKTVKITSNIFAVYPVLTNQIFFSEFAARPLDLRSLRSKDIRGFILRF